MTADDKREIIDAAAQLLEEMEPGDVETFVMAGTAAVREALEQEGWSNGRQAAQG